MGTLFFGKSQGQYLSKLDLCFVIHWWSWSLHTEAETTPGLAAAAAWLLISTPQPRSEFFKETCSKFSLGSLNARSCDLGRAEAQSHWSSTPVPVSLHMPCGVALLASHFSWIQTFHIWRGCACSQFPGSLPAAFSYSDGNTTDPGSLS